MTTCLGAAVGVRGTRPSVGNPLASSSAKVLRGTFAVAIVKLSSLIGP